MNGDEAALCSYDDELKRPDDVMMLNYNYMSDPLPFQVITLFGHWNEMSNILSLCIRFVFCR